MELANFINGSFSKPSSNDYIISENPATGQPLVKVPKSTALDVEKAVEAALSAFKDWKRRTRQERSEFLLKIAARLEERLDEFAQAESQDQGKPLWLAKSVDIPRAVYNFRFFATYILHLEQKSTEIDHLAINYTSRSPRGVAALISPWNLPLYLLTWKIAPAIAFGCTCICKPSEFTSWTAYLLCSVFEEVGLPQGVVNMVFGTGPEVGAALVKNPQIPLVSFTGGTLTGEYIYANSAPHFKKVSLELGGKNANILFADCDLEKAISTSIRSSFLNQGEICLCGSRIFVERSILDIFIKKFVEGTRNLVVGDPNDPNTNIGALISKPHFDKVHSYVEKARQLGGQVLCGGGPANVKGFEKGYFYLPTIIAGLPHECAVCQEEIFGPVVTVIPFDTEQEVIEMANDTKYGLSASIWTINGQKAHRVAKELEVGTAWINCWMVRDLNMPFGGVKASGIGREGGYYSMEFFMEEKTICHSY